MVFLLFRTRCRDPGRALADEAEATTYGPT
jgi:hypothetical protein